MLYGHFNGVLYIARTRNQWRFMPHDYPPWPAIYQQMQRWMRVGCFERLVEDTRILQVATGKLAQLALRVAAADQGDRAPVEAYEINS